MEVEFVTVDVFTDQRFGGNPLAVVPDARGLSAEQMQRIAAEFNLAETTFVLPSANPDNTARVRIFTPRAEMPFAGHPNIGTAFALAQASAIFGRAPTSTMTFEEEAGLVVVEVTSRDDHPSGARLKSPQRLHIGDDVAVDVVASACALREQDIDLRLHAPVIASVGVPFVFAAVTSREALSRARPIVDGFTQHLPMTRATGIHLYVQAKDARADIQARMFAPLFGVPEDPATGSANVCLIGLLARLDPQSDLRLSRTIAQGVDMGRTSVLHAQANKEHAAVTDTWIGGSCVNVMRGVLTVE